MEYIINFFGIISIISIVGSLVVFAVEEKSHFVAAVLTIGFLWFVVYSVSNYDSIIKISIGG